MGSGRGKTHRTQATIRSLSTPRLASAPEYAPGDVVLFKRAKGMRLHQYDGWNFKVHSIKTGVDEWGAEVYRYTIAQVDRNGRNIRISVEASDLSLVSRAEQPEELEAPMLQPAEPSMISF